MARGALVALFSPVRVGKIVFADVSLAGKCREIGLDGGGFGMVVDGSRVYARQTFHLVPTSTTAMVRPPPTNGANMKFSVYGPFEVPRENDLIDTSAVAKRIFWETVESSVEGLPNACGVYVFVIRAKRGALPWYVGLTTKRGFKDESIGPHQTDHYNHSLAKKVGVKPQLYFLAKETPTGRFAKPSQNSHDDIEFLETFMFGVALNRNVNLRNSKNTKFLKNIVVPGIVNTPQRSPTTDERSLKAVLGL